MMEELIQAFPNNISEALSIANDSELSKPKNEIRNILICGMGGSGIGGKLVGAWVEAELNVPYNVIQDYYIPEYVSSNTLVIGSSYSGNTEETLSALEQASSRGAHVVGVCSGGKLEQLCKDNSFDFIKVPGGNPPRTALAFSLVQLLHILSSYNLIDKQRLNELSTAKDLIVSKETQIKEEAKSLATFLKGKVGILYGTTKYEPVLVRARQQFNENGKYLCWHHTIPEMNHNELVGWGGGDSRFAPVFFDTEDLHRRNAKRMEINKTIIEGKAGTVFNLKALGGSLIERSIYFINVVDWASLYLSDVNNVDPIEIEVIDFLKGELANFK